MNLFDKIINFFQKDYIPLPQEEIASYKQTAKFFEPAVNPATGMPMVGATDCMGNPYGHRPMHETNYSGYDYQRTQSSYQSYNYFDNRWSDPFTRY